MNKFEKVSINQYTKDLPTNRADVMVAYEVLNEWEEDKKREEE